MHFFVVVDHAKRDEVSNWLNGVANHVVFPPQTVFMQDRNIHDGVVVLHEMVHELHWKKSSRAIVKIYFEKDDNKSSGHFYCKLVV